MTVDPNDFKAALARFATGVTVVTFRVPDGAPTGVTVNAFNSVSLDPPLVLFCMGKAGQSHAAVVAAQSFTVNVLAADQVDLSNRFAKSGGDKFAGLEVNDGTNGCPVLPGCLATLECRREALHDAGDHTLVIGRVVRLRYAEEGTPLLFFRSAYGRLGGPL